MKINDLLYCEFLKSAPRQNIFKAAYFTDIFTRLTFDHAIDFKGIYLKTYRSHLSQIKNSGVSIIYLYRYQLLIFLYSIPGRVSR